MEQARARHPSDTGEFVEAVTGVAVAGLATLGVGATAYHLVVPGGLISRVFERSLAGGLAVMLALVMVALCVWMTRDFISSSSKHRSSEFLVYGFAAAGAVQAFRFLALGGL